MIRQVSCAVLLVACFSAYADDARVDELQRQVLSLQEQVNALEARTTEPTSMPTKRLRVGSSTDKRNWQRLRKGMSEHEVEQLLDVPENIYVGLSSFFIEQNPVGLQPGDFPLMPDGF